MKLKIHNYWKSKITYMPFIHVSLNKRTCDYLWAIEIAIFGICFSFQKKYNYKY